MDKMQEMFTKNLEQLKNKQTEMNNTLEGINSRMTETEEIRTTIPAEASRTNTTITITES